MMLLRLLRTHLRSYRSRVLGVLVFQFAATIAALFLPSLNADIIDNGVARGDTDHITRIGMVMLAVALVQIAGTVAAVYFGAYTAMGLGRDLRAAVFHRVGSFSSREVALFGAPSLITRTTNDVQQVQMLVLLGCTMMVTAPIMMAGGVIMAVREDVGLSWLLLVCVPALAVSLGLVIARMVPGFRVMQTRIDTVNKTLREQITGIRVVRAFVRERFETQRFETANRELTAVGLGLGRWMAVMFPLVMLILNLSSVAVLWFGGQRVDAGVMQVGSLTAFLAYLIQILISVMMATFMLVMIPRATAAADRIGAVLDTESSVVPPPTPVTTLPERATLRFSGVEFGYPGAGEPVLRGISFTARAGQTTAIIGSTGAGKSTLLGLVPRLFDVTAGEVRVDGVDVRRLDPELLWSKIGLVPQQGYLFSGTVASNLRYGRPDATDAELWAALETAQARGFVEQMTDRLDAPIAQGGTNVSGGQRQRLAIARAVISNPEIYLFDDAFSALDLATDAQVRQALQPITRDAVVVVVAQRVSSIVDADQIMVLEDGAVVGLGRHAALLADCRTYREIVASHPVERGGRGMSRGPSRGPAGGGEVAQKAMHFGPSAKRMLGRMRPECAKVGAVLILAVGSVASAAVGPRILARATDLIFAGVVGRQLQSDLTQAQAVESVRASGETRLADMIAAMEGVVPGQGIDFGAVGQVLWLVLAVYTLSPALGWLQGYLLNDVVVGTVYRMRADIEKKIHRLPLGYFDRQPRGELLSRVTNDIDNVGQSLQQTMSQLLGSLLTVLSVVAMMLYISPSLALIALITIPVSMVVTALIMRRSQALFVTQWQRTGTLSAQVEEAFTGHELTKVFGRRADVDAAFDKENAELFTASFGAQFISGLIMPVMMFIGNLNYVVIAVLGGLRVANGAMSLGDVQAFIQYSRQFTHPLTQVASMVNLLQSGVASAERAFELLDAEEEPAEPGARGETAHGAGPDAQIPRGLEHELPAAPPPPAARPGRVEFEHVSFRYTPYTPLITDLSLLADPGHTVAIVGPTGAGKTTLVNLVMRFYDIDAGRITLDGLDIAEMRRADLRAQIGMVLQDTWLFEGTIRDNIAYGRPDASEADVLAAARATFVDRFVHSLPKQYDTVVADAGGNLSAGERQLITIARAFLADPALLILDEATSSVDTRTELLLQHAMAALRSDRTSFVIAHRLSTIRDADLILVMEAGRIVEQGTHESLVKAGGAYAALYHAQFTAPAVA